MVPLIVNALDIEGGAARAAYRLHKGLRRAGVHSQMLVQSKSSEDKDVIALPGALSRIVGKRRPGLDARLASVLSGGADKDFYPSMIPFSRMRKKIYELAPDIINLHWISGGMFRIEELALLQQPLVWTFHDMWPFTGGCSYSRTCKRYVEKCGRCPQLKRAGDRDLSRKVFDRKSEAYSNLDITVVCPSNWLADKARESSLFGSRVINVIPYGLDLDTYRPAQNESVRSAWNLPREVPLILFGAVGATSDKRKGFDLLQRTLESLRASSIERVELVIFGANRPRTDPNLFFPSTYVGNISDESRLSQLYSAADVTVLPSRDDNLPNVAIESLACGTPVAGFDTGGMTDIIDHQVNGILAPPENPEALAAGIQWILEDRNRHRQLAKQARAAAVEKYSLELQARRYAVLYQQLLDR
ncbi:glycosyltransferase family 4 protein [Pseudomonadota bacterium]